MKKTSLLIGVLALANFAFAAGKTYNITLSKPSKAGSLQLAAGAYQVKVDGANAVFTDSKRHSFSTPIKVESAAKKFQYTSIDSTDSGNTELIHSITLGGSVTKIDFSDSATKSTN
jgi:hypothetical protein